MRPLSAALISSLVFLLAVFTLVALLAGAAPPVTFPPKAGEHLVLITLAKDGDTIKFYWLVEDQDGRLFGLNAPEKNTDAGKAAKKWLAERLPKGPCTVRVFGREKFGRTLVEILLDDGTSLNDAMIEDGFARPWFGKGPKP
jgi:endonuclease YncB( thermonuclease family)